jgi:novobiocin biosynthesis protein NovU/D-mycarose 3-C-methyltransferase
MTQPLANDFRKPGEECAGMGPLVVLMCRRCSLAQLSVTVRPDVMYANYSYVTSKSETMAAHFDRIMQDIIEDENHRPPACPPRMLEIGSNDGTFLERVHRFTGYEVLGVEPASNLSTIAIDRGVRTINRLWDTATAVELSYQKYQADVIVARHVFCHVDDWQGFVHALEFVSHKDTLVFIEVPYVKDMFKNNSFDQVYHEHLSYMSVMAMVHLLAGTKFKLHKIIPYEIHGGAIGIMLRHVEHEGMADVSVDQYSVSESVETLERGWYDLSVSMQKNRMELIKLVLGLNFEGKTVCGFGASAKATVVINACRFTKDDIAVVMDSTPQKQGCLVPGTDIPIVPDMGVYKFSMAKDSIVKPDYLVIFSWNFQSEIMAKNKDFKGRWIIPCPEVKVI